MQKIDIITSIINEGWEVFQEENHRNYGNHKMMVEEYKKLTGEDIGTCFCNAHTTFNNWKKYLKGIGKIG
jgi:hypothetical protein